MRTLAIVLAVAFLCAVGAWFVSRKSMQALPSSTRALVHSDASSVPDAADRPAAARGARADLTTLVPVVLPFEGPSATLNLQIIDATAKQPIPDVAVRIHDTAPEAPTSGSEPGIVSSRELTEFLNPPLTDGSGRLMLRVPASRVLTVEVSGTLVRTERRGEELAAFAEGEIRSVTLELAAEDDLHVFGRVSDAITNADLAGVEIQLERRPSIEPIAVSDAHGRFELRTNSWESRNASASKRGYVTQAFELADQHDSRVHPQQLELKRAALVQGFYRDGDDKPLEDGSLRFWTRSGFSAHVYTREDGWFEAYSLPTDEAVEVDLELRHRPVVLAVASLTLAPGETRRADWKLPARHSIRGIVRDESNAPVSGCEVSLYWGTADAQCLGVNQPVVERDSCSTNKEGQFEFSDVTEGRWLLGARNSSSLSMVSEGPRTWPIPVAAESVTVPVPDAQELVLRCWTHTTIQGHVIDVDRNPVQEGSVRIQMVGCEALAERSIGRDGAFSIAVPGPWNYEVRAVGDGWGWFLDSEKVAARGGDHDVVLQMKPAARLRVRVVDSSSHDQVGAELFGVGRSAAGEESISYQNTDEQGFLEMPRPAGSYRLFARTLDGRCGSVEDVRVDLDDATRIWTIEVTGARLALVHSAKADGLIEAYFQWNGIPIEQEEIEKDAKLSLRVPPGILVTRYRREDPVGDWHTLESTIAETGPTDIDLPFP
jgi:hypothetical protein